METAKVNSSPNESQNITTLLWIGTLFLGFIPGLILFLTKKEDAYINDQSKEALNWSITATIAYVIAIALSFIVIGIFLLPVIGICHLIFCIMGAVASAKGKPFRVPFALRLVK